MAYQDVTSVILLNSSFEKSLYQVNEMLQFLDAVLEIGTDGNGQQIREFLGNKNKIATLRNSSSWKNAQILSPSMLIAWLRNNNFQGLRNLISLMEASYSLPQLKDTNGDSSRFYNDWYQTRANFILSRLLPRNLKNLMTIMYSTPGREAADITLRHYNSKSTSFEAFAKEFKDPRLFELSANIVKYIRDLDDNSRSRLAMNEIIQFIPLHDRTDVFLSFSYLYALVIAFRLSYDVYNNEDSNKDEKRDNKPTDDINSSSISSLIDLLQTESKINVNQDERLSFKDIFSLNLNQFELVCKNSSIFFELISSISNDFDFAVFVSATDQTKIASSYDELSSENKLTLYRCYRNIFDRLAILMNGSSEAISSHNFVEWFSYLREFLLKDSFEITSFADNYLCDVNHFNEFVLNFIFNGTLVDRTFLVASINNANPVVFIFSSLFGTLNSRGISSDISWIDSIYVDVFLHNSIKQRFIFNTIDIKLPDSNDELEIANRSIKDKASKMTMDGINAVKGLVKLGLDAKAYVSADRDHVNKHFSDSDSKGLLGNIQVTIDQIFGIANQHNVHIKSDDEQLRIARLKTPIISINENVSPHCVISTTSNGIKYFDQLDQFSLSCEDFILRRLRSMGDLNELLKTFVYYLTDVSDGGNIANLSDFLSRSDSPLATSIGALSKRFSIISDDGVNNADQYMSIDKLFKHPDNAIYLLNRIIYVLLIKHRVTPIELRSSKYASYGYFKVLSNAGEIPLPLATLYSDSNSGIYDDEQSTLNSSIINSVNVSLEITDVFFVFNFLRCRLSRASTNFSSKLTTSTLFALEDTIVNLTKDTFVPTKMRSIAAFGYGAGALLTQPVFVHPRAMLMREIALQSMKTTLPYVPGSLSNDDRLDGSIISDDTINHQSSPFAVNVVTIDVLYNLIAAEKAKGDVSTDILLFKVLATLTEMTSVNRTISYSTIKELFSLCYNFDLNNMRRLVMWEYEHNSNPDLVHISK